MSAMDKMLGDMLKKAIPPEVLEMLSQENISAFVESANAFKISIESKLDNILENQSVIIERLENVGSEGSKGSSRSSG